MASKAKKNLDDQVFEEDEDVEDVEDVADDGEEIDPNDRSVAALLKRVESLEKNRENLQKRLNLVNREAAKHRHRADDLEAQLEEAKSEVQTFKVRGKVSEAVGKLHKKFASEQSLDDFMALAGVNWSELDDEEAFKSTVKELAEKRPHFFTKLEETKAEETEAEETEETEEKEEPQENSTTGAKVRSKAKFVFNDEDEENLKKQFRIT